MRIRESSGSDANVTHVYRGLHRGHPAATAALRGVVFPGDPNGTVSPEQHNLGDQSAKSPFTSWTYDRDVAEKYAFDRGTGIILRLPFAPPLSKDGWSWQKSPDIFGEDEVLLRGSRMDAEVIFGGGTRGGAKAADVRTGNGASGDGEGMVV